MEINYDPFFLKFWLRVGTEANGFDIVLANKIK